MARPTGPKSSPPATWPAMMAVAVASIRRAGAASCTSQPERFGEGSETDATPVGGWAECRYRFFRCPGRYGRRPPLRNPELPRSGGTAGPGSSLLSKRITRQSMGEVSDRWRRGSRECEQLACDAFFETDRKTVSPGGLCPKPAWHSHLNCPSSPRRYFPDRQVRPGYPARPPRVSRRPSSLSISSAFIWSIFRLVLIVAGVWSGASTCRWAW